MWHIPSFSHGNEHEVFYGESNFAAKKLYIMMMIFKQEFIVGHLNYNSDTTVMFFSCYLLGAIWLDTRGTSFKHWLNPPGDRMDTLLVKMEMWKLRGQSLWMFKWQFGPNKCSCFEIIPYFNCHIFFNLANASHIILYIPHVPPIYLCQCWSFYFYS